MLTTLQPGGVILFKRNIEEAAQTHALCCASAEDRCGGRCSAAWTWKAGRSIDFAMRSRGFRRLWMLRAAAGSLLMRKHGLLIGQATCAPWGSTRILRRLWIWGWRRRARRWGRERYRLIRTWCDMRGSFLRGLRGQEYLGCGKHFPGLGGGALDSHEALPVVERTWKQLWEEDLVPYRELKNTVPFVMVAHVSYPKIVRDGTPASLSKRWIEGVLREKIGYRGLVVSDDLDMGGVLNGASIEDAAVETLEAGSDMFLVCQREEHVWRAWEAVVRRAERDRRFARLIAAKAKRVAAFQARSDELKARMAPAPTAKTVDTLRRRVWEFEEQLSVAGGQLSEKIPTLTD